MTHLGVNGDLGWSWVLKKVLFSFKILKVTYGWWSVEVTSCKVSNVKTSHFNIGILDKPEVFSRQFLYQKDDRNPKLCLLFENCWKIIDIKSHSSKDRGRIPIGIHKSARVKDDLLGWKCKIEVLLSVTISPIFNNRESPPFQSPIISYPFYSFLYQV